MLYNYIINLILSGIHEFMFVEHIIIIVINNNMVIILYYDQ